MKRAIGRLLRRRRLAPGQSLGSAFDPRYYCASNPELGLTAKAARRNYATVGWREHRSPNALFSVAWYLSQYPDVAGKGVEPLGHYLAHGWKEGRDPSPLFSTRAYLAAHPDVAEAGICPLAHYLSDGWREGRKVAWWFDADWYRGSAGLDLPADTDPLTHYLTVGWRAGLRPGPHFDTQYYLSQNPDVRAAGVEPVGHFLTVGLAKGLRPHPDRDFAELMPETARPDGGFLAAQAENAAKNMHGEQRQEQAEPPKNALMGNLKNLLSKAKVEAVRGPVGASKRQFFFDADWYLAENSSLDVGREAALDHYLARGWREGRDPHPLFSTAWYLSNNADVAEAGVEPFAHFLQSGWREGRSPFLGFDQEFYLSRLPEAANFRAGPWGHYVTRGFAKGLSPNILFDPEWYRSQSSDLSAYSGDLYAHYIRRGWMDGLSPHPCFDPVWYRRQLIEAELREADIIHYLRSGHRDGLSPSPVFDEKWYKSQYVYDQNTPGLSHYLAHGIRFKAWPNPLFDPDYYGSQIPDPAQSSLVHYLKHGEAEGFRPNPMFSAFQYVARNPGTVPYGVSPLAHFIAEGDASQLSPSVEFRSKRYWSRYLSWSEHQSPLRHYMLHGRHAHFEIPNDGQSLLRDPLKWLKSRHDQRGRGFEAIQAVGRRAKRKSQLAIVIVQIGKPVRARERVFAEHVRSVVDKKCPVPIQYVQIEKIEHAFDAARRARRAGMLNVVVFLDFDSFMTVAETIELCASLEGTDAAALALPLVLDRNLDVANSGLEMNDVLALPRSVGGDPDHPLLRVKRRNLVAGAPVFAIRLNDLIETAVSPEPGHSVAQWSADLSLSLLDRGKETTYLPAVRAVTWRPEVIPTRRLPASLSAKAAPKKLLFIDSLITMPDRDAGSYYALSLMRMYQSWGYEITFCPDADYNPDPHYVEALEREGVVVLRAPFVTATASYIESTRDTYDVVLMARVHSGGAHLERVKAKWPNALLVFHPGDLHYLREQREAIMNDDIDGFAFSISTRKREHLVIEQSDLTVLVSEFELGVLKKLGLADKAHVIAPEYSGSALGSAVYDPAKRGKICFIGGYRHMPNVDAAEFLAKEVWPLVTAKRPKLVLELVGSDPPRHFKKFDSRNVKVVGFVPDIDEYLDTVRLSIAAVRYGAGIKMKLIASLEAGVPTIATSTAAEGIGIPVGHGYVVADEAEEIASKVIKLYDRTSELKSMSELGRKAVRSRFSREAVYKHYREVLDGALAAREARKLEAKLATKKTAKKTPRRKSKAARSRASTDQSV